MEESAPRQVFDRRFVAASRARALKRGMPDFLAQALAIEIEDRMGAILRNFPLILIHRGRPSDLRQRLTAARPDSKILTSDSTVHDVDVVFDEEAIPFAAASLDAVIWPLGLEQVNDVPGSLIQIRRALRGDGLFLGAVLAGDTLAELRDSLIAAESEQAGGAAPRVGPFADIRTWGSLLQRAGFALPVVDSDRLTVRYSNALALMHDLRALGLANALSGRRRTLAPRSLLAAAAAHYAQRFSDSDGRIRATFEIAYLTAWAPHESQQKPLKPGSARMRLADALKTTENSFKPDD